MAARLSRSRVESLDFSDRHFDDGVEARQFTEVSSSRCTLNSPYRVIDNMATDSIFLVRCVGTRLVPNPAAIGRGREDRSLGILASSQRITVWRARAIAGRGRGGSVASNLIRKDHSNWRRDDGDHDRSGRCRTFQRDPCILWNPSPCRHLDVLPQIGRRTQLDRRCRKAEVTTRPL